MILTFVRTRCIRKGVSLVRLKTNLYSPRSCFCNDSGGDTEKTKDKVGGFAKAFEKFSHPTHLEDVKEEVSFAQLLRNSKFIDMGDPEGKVVLGTIFHIVNDDLYIDFGWKFHCVCPRPTKNGRAYVRGSKVKIRIRDLELSTRFLGHEKDLTVLEADATLLSLVSSPSSSG